MTTSFVPRSFKNKCLIAALVAIGLICWAPLFFLWSNGLRMAAAEVMVLASGALVMGCAVYAHITRLPNDHSLILSKTGFQMRSRLMREEGLFTFEWSDLSQIAVFDWGKGNRQLVVSVSPRAARGVGLKSQHNQGFATRLDRAMKVGSQSSIKHSSGILMLGVLDVNDDLMQVAGKMVDHAKRAGISGQGQELPLFGVTKFNWLVG